MTRPKPVNWQLIEDNKLYTLVKELIVKFHGGEKTGLEDLEFVLMWKHNVKPDQDGYIVLSDITKSSDKVRELRPHDMIIGINKLAWDMLNDPQKSVVIDMQLERIAICLNKNGSYKEDDKYRKIYRLKKKEVIEDSKMLSRHGTTIADTQSFIYDKLSKSFEEGSYIDQHIK